MAESSLSEPICPIATRIDEEQLQPMYGSGIRAFAAAKETWYYNTMKLAYSLSASTFCRSSFLTILQPVGAWVLTSEGAGEAGIGGAATCFIRKFRIAELVAGHWEREADHLNAN